MRAMVCLALAMTTTSSVAVEVYRSTAADGTVIYSDRPSNNDSVPFLLATGRPATPPPAPPAAAASRPTQPPRNATRPDAAAPPPRAPTPAELADERARNCATARERSERYNMSPRLYRALPNGEREYLDDSEIDAARAQAAADVRSWCD